MVVLFAGGVGIFPPVPSHMEQRVVEVLVSSAAIFILDQLSKRFVAARESLPAIGSLGRIRHVRSGRQYYSSAAVQIAGTAIWIAAFLAAQFLAESGVAFYLPGQAMGLGIALGGAAGNLADVIRTQTVTDFIDLGWWPVFNLADVAIIAGLLLAFWPQ